MKKIAIEEHFLTENYKNYLRSRKEYPWLKTVEDKKEGRTEYLWRGPDDYFLLNPERDSKLLDPGKGRLKEMDKAGLDMQVLSLSGPSVDVLDAKGGTMMAKEINDELADIVKKNPERYAGFAAIAVQEPEKAAEELERAVKKLGFVGAKVSSHVGEDYFDNKKYWPIFEMAQKLDVPIYIHPREPMPGMLEKYSLYPGLQGPMWGFAAETGLHAMRLVCCGVFDKYPRLKIMLGHLGEALPYFLWRVDSQGLLYPFIRKLARKPSEYIKQHFWVTTSGMFWLPAFLCAYLALGADKILFAVDYPYESTEIAVKFIDTLPICDEDKAKVCHLNAEKILKL